MAGGSYKMAGGSYKMAAVPVRTPVNRAVEIFES